MDNLKKGRLRDIYLPLTLFLLILAGAVFAAQVGPKNLFVAVTTGNNAPIVHGNNSNGSVTLIDGGLTQFTIQFNVTDADGTGNINNAGVGVNVTYNGIKVSNNTGNCAITNPSSTTRSFSCIVVFRYFDNSSAIWEINLSAEDNAGAKAHNDSHNYGAASGGPGARNLTVNSLSAFTLQTPSLATSANLGDSNKELQIIVNNTGNFDFSFLNVTPFDLNTSLTDIFALEGNFSINSTSSTGVGFGKALFNATPTNFTGLGDQNQNTTLPHKITNAEADKFSNRTLYIYIDVPSDKGLTSSVTYNASRPWQLFAT